MVAPWVVMLHLVNPSLKPLLARSVPATCKDHIVQFYQTDAFLSEAVAHYIRTGLDLGEAVVIIATTAHLSAFTEELSRVGCRVDGARASGQLLFLDAAETLAQLLVDGMPDWNRFRLIVGGIIETMQTRFASVRAYGEMVDILRSAGNAAGMVCLEQYWNDLAASMTFALLCSYNSDAFSDDTQATAFDAVCKAHSHVLPAEPYLRLRSVDAQMREIASLQREAGALKSELKKRQTAEAALQRSEHFKNLIIESSRDCIKVLDLEARLLFLNRAGMAALEVTDLAALQGRSWLDFWSGDDKRSATQAFEAAKAGESKKFTGFCPTMRSKTPKWWDVVVSPIVDEAGQVTTILVVSRDITEHKLMELELRQAVRARDEFLSVASHELNTPITSLKLQVQMQQRRHAKNDPTLFDSERVGKLLDVTNRSVGRLAKLVDNMLDMSRISHGKLHLECTQIDLGVLAREVVDRFDDELSQAGCPYRLTVDNALMGMWDPYRLEQVIANLLTNVIKYAPGKPVEISVTAADGNAVLVVRDHGVGIAEASLERIFQRFERAIAASNVSGLGLGLYISRQIIKAHNGKMWAESELGQGSTFHVALPLLPNHPCATVSHTGG